MENSQISAFGNFCDCNLLLGSQRLAARDKCFLWLLATSFNLLAALHHAAARPL
jgi:hypothetical protein